MECNKDEAVRAKVIAEKKMENNDFEGARKFLSKAQNLYPALENITQLLAVCNVHCSAKNGIVGSERDWYGILQVEKFSDESTIKKQYRKLALYLHPDKNRAAGAEAAFKLIGEANMILSDPTKRSVYDSKIRFSGKPMAAPHHMNRSSQSARQYGAPTHNLNGFPAQFNTQYQTQANRTAGQGVFWTQCPFCNARLQYERQFVNRNLVCPKCSRPYVAYEIGTQGEARAGHVPTPSGFEKKHVPDQDASRKSVKNNSGFPVSGEGSHAAASTPTESATYVRVDLKPKEGASRRTNPVTSKRGGGSSNGDGTARASRDLKNKSRKRGRKQIAESSESSDASVTAEEEDMAVEKDSANRATEMASGINGFHFRRRSGRARQHVTYNESDDDDDFVSPPKRPRERKLTGDDEEEHGGNVDVEASNTSAPAGGNNNAKSKVKQMGGVPAEGNLPDKNGNDGAMNKRGATVGAETIDLDDDSGSDADSDENSNKLYDCPDPEFNDFEKSREESCFSTGQIWACYDTADGMPRFYAQVKKVIARPEFQLRITWLEADPEYEPEEDWVREELPVGCGRFKLHRTGETAGRLTFSHQVCYYDGRKKGSFIIYPRIGEIWALFKDWDMRWSSDPENHKPFKYEVVEVLSDFVEGAGVEVAYLDKVAGFVSLFQRTSQSDMLVIPPNELLRFSHGIPSFRMTGSERRGVPEGSFELDPACLPLNPDDLFYPSKTKVNVQC